MTRWVLLVHLAVGTVDKGEVKMEVTLHLCMFRELLCMHTCSGQVISDSSIDFFDVDSRSKALGDKLPSFECSLMLL